MAVDRTQARPKHAIRWATFSTLIVVLSLVIAACSGPGGSDDPEPTATTAAVVEPTAEAAPTETPEPTSTPEPPATATATATAEPTATHTAVPEPTATPQPPEPTATPVPPVSQTGGAELRIEGKPITSMLAADDSGSVLYALTEAGISRSDNAGGVWFASGEQPEGNMIVALNTADVLYAGDRGSCGMGSSGTPLTRSTNGGRDWETFAGGEGIEPYLVEAGQQSIVIGADCGLQVSTDGGQTWARIAGSEGMDFFSATASSNTLDEEILAVGVTEGGTGRLFLVDMSTPGNVQVNEALAQFWGAAAIDWAGERMVIATATRTGVSDDGGVNWSWSRTGLENATYSVDPLLEGIPEEESGMNFMFDVVKIDPTDPDRIWIGGEHGAYLSEDAGATWRRVGDDVPIDSIVISETAERVFVSAAGGTRVWTLDGQ